MDEGGPAPVTDPGALRSGLSRLGSTLPGQLLIVLFGLWIAMAAAIPVHDSQDAIPMVVAGDLLGQDPSSIYNPDASGLYDLNPVFRDRSCALYGPSGDCDARAVAFLSPPTALIPVGITGLLPDAAAVKVYNMAAALGAAAAFAIVWVRLSSRSEEVRWLISMTALLATLPIVAAIELGQTSPLMYLSVALGLAWSDRAKLRAAAAAVLAVCIAFKAWPALLVLLVLVERRWRWAAATISLAGAATAAALLLGGVELLGDFARSTASVGRHSASNPYNGGIETVLGRSLGLADSGWPVGVVAMVIRAAIVAVAARAVWRSPGDARWATAWVCLVVTSPLLWIHYAPIGLMGIAVAVAGTDASDRWLWAMPVWGLAALATRFLDPLGELVPLARFGLVAAPLAVIVVISLAGSSSRGEVGPTSAQPTVVS